MERSQTCLDCDENVLHGLHLRHFLLAFWIKLILKCVKQRPQIAKVTMKHIFHVEQKTSITKVQKLVLKSQQHVVKWIR